LLLYLIQHHSVNHQNLSLSFAFAERASFSILYQWKMRILQVKMAARLLLHSQYQYHCHCDSIVHKRLAVLYVNISNDHILEQYS